MCIIAPATIRDVAKKADVGVGTVSRVLNNSPAVSKATREKVLNVIDELDYIPNPIARQLSIGRTLTICILLVLDLTIIYRTLAGCSTYSSRQ